MSTLILPDKETETMLQRVAEELDISQADALREGLHTLLERRLREVRAQIFEITGQYDVTSVEDMEARYAEGTLAEAESWRDLQRLDHLEYKRDKLQQLLEAL